MTRVIGLAVLVVLAAGLPASAGSHSRNAGIVWAQGSAIWGSSVDGRQKRLVTTYFGGRITDGFSSPAWSPSGEVLAYDNCASDSCWIHLVRPAGGVKQTLGSAARLIEFHPAWSPDGRELAFATGVSGAPVLGRGISAVSLSTRLRRTITPSKRYRWDDSPDWSADGATLAFTRHVMNQPPVVYLVGRDGRGLKWLTRGESPSWSPSGRSLVFAWDNGIYRVGADGRGRTLLASGDVRGPRWSPDGRKILYTTALAIWVMNANGTGRERVIVFPAGRHITGVAWKPA